MTMRITELVTKKRRHLLLLLLSARYRLATPTSTVGCDGGACPSPFMLNDDTSTSTSTSSDEGLWSDSRCGFWLGPSNIKREENHGFGLGLFTGIAISKGTAIEPLYNGGQGTVGEPLLPFFGAEALYEQHPPLREYVWGEDNMPEVAVVYPAGLTALFGKC
jgi:hypothetical protein